MSAQVEQLEDAFLKVSFEEEPAFPASKPTVDAKFPGRNPQVYPQWIQHTSSDRHDDEVWTVNALRKAYPGHHVVPTLNLSTLNFPDVLVMPSEDDDSIVRAAFVPLARSSEIPGVVLKQPVYATYTVFWKEFEFKAVVIEYPVTWSTQTELFLVHKGSEATVHELIVAAGAYGEELHGQIWVYDNGWWDKDAGLYEEVQKANWDDVILKPAYKAQIQGEISGFYSQKKIYKDLGIPWKRGLIFHGPPGNGKSISMKAIMKGVPAVPLYVRNFNHWGGPEAAMKMVFSKARQNSPSLLILEDLDALITPQTRSFFLNQIDGLDNNDGILIIGTTNYLERIDPALSKRPSRFDRKLLFDNPDHEERILYCKYWQHKLASNKELDFPDELLKDIADNTDKFSFAFLKEVFVNTLVKLATGSETSPFPKAIMRTIKELRDQIDTEPDYVPHVMPQVTFAPPPGPPPGVARSFHTHFRRLMEQ